MTETELEKAGEYSLNTKQTGEALELLSNCENNSVGLVFLDPQYEPVRQVLRTDYPLYSQSDYQFLKILEKAKRLIKPFALLFIGKKKTSIGQCRRSFVIPKN